MRIHNLYVDADGQSHFRDIEVEWVEETHAGKLSRRLPANGIIFREVQPDYDLDWHPGRILQIPVQVALTGQDGTRVAAAHRHHQVGPPHVVHVQLVRRLAGEVDAGLGHHLDHLRVDGGGGPAAGRARLVPPCRSLLEQRLRDL